jgi:hypothetical protein
MASAGEARFYRSFCAGHENKNVSAGEAGYFKSMRDGAVAQLVEQRTENPCVGGSIPPHTTLKKAIITKVVVAFFISRRFWTDFF